MTNQSLQLLPESFYAVVYAKAAFGNAICNGREERTQMNFYIDPSSGIGGPKVGARGIVCKKRGWFGTKLLVYDGDQVVGRVVRTGPFCSEEEFAESAGNGTRQVLRYGVKMVVS
jgi:hypothetical protein